MIDMVNRNPSPRDLRGFAASMLFGFGLIGGLLWWASARQGRGWQWQGTGGQWTAIALWTVGVVTAAITGGTRGPGKAVYVNWMLAAAAMGKVMMPVFFTVLFFTILPVFSLIRLKDPLRKKLGATGYWEKHRPHDATLERMRRPF